MGRLIEISTEVFSAIWAARQQGEETENDILHRLLCRSSDKTKISEKDSPISEKGVFDARNNVHFPAEFEIFRHYKRKEYKAIARNGSWIRTDTNQSFPNINQLNASIAAGNENVWNGNWKYRKEDGAIRSIADLRK